MEKYMSNLYEEFKRARPGNLNEKIFSAWLEEKKEILKYYKAFIETMDFIPRRGVVELNKGKYDSVLSCLRNDDFGILVSEYADTFENSKKVKSIDGKIEINENNIMLKYSKNEKNINFINFFITEFPTNKETITLLAKLTSLGKNIFIGTYGNLNDFDYLDKVKELYNLKNELQIYLGKNFDGEIITTSNYYLTSITPKYKYKKH